MCICKRRLKYTFGADKAPMVLKVSNHYTVKTVRPSLHNAVDGMCPRKLGVVVEKLQVCRSSEELLRIDRSVNAHITVASPSHTQRSFCPPGN